MNLYNYDEILDITNIVLCPSYCKLINGTEPRCNKISLWQTKFGQSFISSSLNQGCTVVHSHFLILKVIGKIHQLACIK